jgi:hypothetical protein
MPSCGSPARGEAPLRPASLAQGAPSEATRRLSTVRHHEDTKDTTTDEGEAGAPGGSARLAQAHRDADPHARAGEVERERRVLVVADRGVRFGLGVVGVAAAVGRLVPRAGFAGGGPGLPGDGTPQTGREGNQGKRAPTACGASNQDFLGSAFVPSPSVISSRRPRLTSSGGAGMVISSTPSLKFAFAWSAIAPSGSGMNRLKLP